MGFLEGMNPLDIAGKGVGLLGSLYSGVSNIIGGNKEVREAEQLLNEFEYPELNNVFEGMQLATLGGNILREDASQTSSDILDSARQSGGRFLGQAGVQAQRIQERASRTAAADIDQQFAAREKLIAQDDAAIRGMEERRSAEELAGIGSRLNYGKQQKQQGFRDFINTGFATSSMFGGQGTPSSQANGNAAGGTYGLPSYDFGYTSDDNVIKNAITPQSF